MSPNEILEYVTEGMKWLVLGGGTYIGALYVIAYAERLSKPVNSQEELEQVVDVEAPKLGLDPTKIDAKYNSRNEGSRKNGDRYDLFLDSNFLTTKATVRHELYHILKDCDKGDPSFFRYFFIAEPRAVLYGSFKIKL